MATHHEKKTPHTLGEAIQAYLTHTRLQYSPQTSTAYSQALHLFTKMLESRLGIKSKVALERLDIGWGEEFLCYLQEERSIETEHLYSRAILDFYRYVEDQHWVESHYEELNRRFAAKRRHKKHTIPTPPVEAVEQILTYIQATTAPPEDESTYREQLRIQRDKAMLILLAETGLRVSEVCDLKKDQIDLERQVLLLEGTMTLPISPIATKTIQTYLEWRSKLDKGHPASDLPLFARHDKRAGKRVLHMSRWTVGNIVKYWAKKALPAELHLQLEQEEQSIAPQTFRHYFVVKTLSQTGDLLLTQSLARHADPSTTRRYLRSSTTSDTKEPTN